MSDTAKQAKQAKPPKDKKSRRKGDAAAPSGGPVLSIAGHPRARRSVREIKAWVGLAGFGAALVLSLQANVPLAMAAERALAAGIAGYLVAWGCAVAVWRALITAELRARAEAMKAQRERAAAPTVKPAGR